MGRGRWHEAGKIQQVCAAVREYQGPLRLDILRLGDGLRFDDGRLSWDDLHALIYHAPPHTALFHAVEKGWGTTDHLVAIAADALHDLIWQNTEDGHKGRRRPKRIPRPTHDDGTAPMGAFGRASVLSVEDYEKRRRERQRRWLRRRGKGA